MNGTKNGFWTAIAGLLALPALHPLLIPVLGLPSHLLWWVHVLPVALVAFRRGRYAAAAIALLSTGFLVAGERLFGRTRWTPFHPVPVSSSCRSTASTRTSW